MNINKLQIIDVTLRESIYTHLNISYKDAIKYIKLLNEVSYCKYIEIGYIDVYGVDKNLSVYDSNYIKIVKDTSEKNISAMFHLKQFNDAIKVWDKDVISLLDMVRIVIDDEIDNLKEIINYFHSLGVRVAINISYISKRNISILKNIIKKLKEYESDVVFFADTNGSLFPNEIIKIYNNVKKKNMKMGFHGHNHYGMVVANSISMIKAKVDYIDVTSCGYGKGSGNLNLEIIPFILSKEFDYKVNEIDLNSLYKLILFFGNNILKDELYVYKYINMLYAYKNLTLKEIKSIEKTSSEDDIINNIMEYEKHEK